MTIEDIVLSRDRRGISKLRHHIADDFCDRAAQLVLDHKGTAVIVTGFYILTADAPETDGPPGAVAIGNALTSLGYNVVYVSDLHHLPMLQGLIGSNAKLINFPITTDDSSRLFAEDLIRELNPSILISIERCGINQQGSYRNMHMKDISLFTGKTDHLFTNHSASIGIGDGGNEIGMGNLKSVIPDIPTLTEPCVTTTTELVLCSVSNWGGYGLVASLSKKIGRVLLPSVAEERDLVKQTTDLGAVDGMSTKQEYKVDGFTLEENSAVVAELHEILTAEGISS
ncbi:MAG: DUF4392 domain-containing protein [SAR202 cluster bacterium]|nr:DUF4392 domain-containing protein [SAR202 cluster bacterium]